MPSFGRIPEFDERSRNYPVRTLLGSRRTPQSKLWPCTTHLDQGDIGACVGFSWSHELIAEPEVVPDVDAAYALNIYHRAQALDEWEGENYEGTSVLAGAKAIVESGWLTEYRWAFGIDDLLETVSFFGPVILGINWYTGMMDLDADGFVVPSGSIAGGHAILAKGVNVSTQGVILHNSWGESWGIKGDASIAWSDLDRLLKEDGECCVPVTRTQVKPEPDEPEVQDGCLTQIIRNIFGLNNRPNLNKT